MLERRLAGMRIQTCRYQGIHPGTARKLIGPVHGHKRSAGALPGITGYPHQGVTDLAGKAHEAALLQSVTLNVLGVQRGKGFAQVGKQTSGATGACHGVPLVANTTAVENDREGIADLMHLGVLTDDETTTTIRCGEASVTKAARVPLQRPLLRLPLLILVGAQVRSSGHIQPLAKSARQCGERRVLCKNLVFVLIGKRGGVAHATGHFGNNPPVPFCVAGGFHKRTLARYTAFGVGHHAGFFTPAQRGQTDIGTGQGVAAGHAVGHHHGIAGHQRMAHPVRLGQGIHRIGGHDPHRFYLTAFHRIEKVHSGEAVFFRQRFGLPEIRHGGMVFRIIDIQVHGKLVG